MFVKVKTAAGDVQYVPEHWLGHKVLGRGLTRVDRPEKPHTTGKETREGEGDA